METLQLYYAIDPKHGLLPQSYPWGILFPTVLEEIRQNNRDGTSSKGEDEEKFAFYGKAKKGKGKKSESKIESSQGGKKNDLSKIK